MKEYEVITFAVNKDDDSEYTQLKTRNLDEALKTARDFRDHYGEKVEIRAYADPDRENTGNWDYDIVVDKWYAVLADREDTDWGTGSYDLEEAKEMLKDYPEGLIAVIEMGNDPICIEEISYRDIYGEDLHFQFEASPEGNILWAENDDISIKASVEVPERASEDYGYLAMKREIKKVLEEKGLTASFFYDGQEGFLEADANDGEVEIDIDEF